MRFGGEDGDGVRFLAEADQDLRQRDFRADEIDGRHAFRGDRGDQFRHAGAQMLLGQVLPFQQLLRGRPQFLRETGRTEIAPPESLSAASCASA